MGPLSKIEGFKQSPSDDPREVKVEKDFLEKVLSSSRYFKYLENQYIIQTSHSAPYGIISIT